MVVCCVSEANTSGGEGGGRRGMESHSMFCVMVFELKSKITKNKVYPNYTTQ